MSKFLIKDTTREEREKIVADSIGVPDGLCDDGELTTLREMYEDYIEGKKEISEINAEFHAAYIMDDDDKDRGRSCMC